MCDMGVLEPHRHMCVARIMVILHLALIHPQYWEWYCPAFFADICASTLITVFSYLPKNLTTDTTKGVACCRWLAHGCEYSRFSSFSADYNALSGSLYLKVFAYMSVTLKSMIQYVPCSHKTRIITSPMSSIVLCCCLWLARSFLAGTPHVDFQFVANHRGSACLWCHITEIVTNFVVAYY
jgi:hypothetical protein